MTTEKKTKIEIVTSAEYDGGFAQMAADLYEKSAFTILGSPDAMTTVMDLITALGKIGINYANKFFVFSGADMNTRYGLTGNNRYQDGLTCISFMQTDQEIGRLAIFKMQVGARWFDDIVDNNARRERE
jgi:hypothetical protein